MVIEVNRLKVSPDSVTPATKRGVVVAPRSTSPVKTKQWLGLSGISTGMRMRAAGVSHNHYSPDSAPQNAPLWLLQSLGGAVSSGELAEATHSAVPAPGLSQ